MSRFIKIMTVLGLVLCLGGVVVAQEIDRTFGVVEAYFRPDDAVALGASWDRIIFHWYQFQPNGPGSLDTTALPDSYFEAAAAGNREIVGLIKGTPAWASASGSVGAVPNGVTLPYDDPGNVFGAFVMDLVRHYAPRGVHRWIIWNEPDIRPGEGTVEFEGEVEDYYHLLRTAYLAAHTVDPQAQVHLAGLTWWYDQLNGREPYLSRLLAVIAADQHAVSNNWYFDVVSLHIYFTTTSVPYIIDSTRDILSRYRLANKPLWLNEYNASPRRDPDATISAPFNVSLEQQADFIVQASAIALASGVERMAVYRLYDDNFSPGQTEPWGLVRHTGIRRPAFTAYQRVIQQFSGASSIQHVHIPEATLVTFAFPDSTLYVMWSDTFDSGEFLIHARSVDGPVEVTDALGASYTLALVPEQGTPLAIVQVPPAEQIDFPWPVVSGPTRMLRLPGEPRTVWFRTPDSRVAQLR